MKRIILLCLAALSLMVSCQQKRDADYYTEWLYSSMPLPDSLSFSREFWEANVNKTLEVREAMGWNVPEREFRHFVLPLRAGNEDLDDFRTTYADTLCRRVAGMDMRHAALEINHWCHEQATYQPSDARTSTPCATVRRGLGRCGEESVLGVAAMRAAGIPARQVYTPRWAHTDDNHAWVEVWIDGKWYFMGACEPEADLNMAWFNSPVSRAMVLHTRVAGDYPGPEDVIQKTACYTEINVIRGYVPARRTVVTVVDRDGKSVEGAKVSFKIYNYAEFYPICYYTTDSNGQVGLDMGLGDIFIWAHKDGQFGFAKADSESATVCLDHVFGETFGADMDIIPPVENPIPTNASQEDILRNAQRLEQEDLVRASHDHSNPGLERFKTEHPQSPLPSMLCHKDLTDIPYEVLVDMAISETEAIQPRVWNEKLLPFREEMLAAELGFNCPEDIATWVKTNIKIIDGRNPQRLRIAPIIAFRSRLSDEASLKALFVALCRSYGFTARVDEVTLKAQYLKNGAWIDAGFDPEVSESTANYVPVKLVNTLKGRTAHYYNNFSISRIREDGSVQLMEFPEGASYKDVTSLEAGNYILTTGTRLSDGSVLAHMEFFTLESGEEAVIPLVFRNREDRLSVIGTMDAEHHFLMDGKDESQSILSATGRGFFLMCIMGDKDEPTSHARSELTLAAEQLNSWGRPCVILGKTRPEGITNAIYGSDPDGSNARMLCEGCEKPLGKLPIIAMCDSFGRIVYYSSGYNTSLASDLSFVINNL